MHTILVVEDDPELRELLTIILDFDGYAVLEAVNGREAWAICGASPIPDLILLDIEMPVMNGWEFLEQRAEDDHVSMVPVVITSATDASTKAQQYRGVQVLRKPFFANQVLTMTRQALERCER